jgi:hypothetical protein
MLSTIVKLSFKTSSENQMKISSLLITSVLALPKALSASETEGKLRGTERSLLACRNNAQWVSKDYGCTDSLPICGNTNGNQIGWQAPGDDCFKCIRASDNMSPYPYNDYGCTTTNPTCDAAGNKAGKSCLGNMEVPCKNTAAYSGLDQGCETAAPMCVAENGGILPADVAGDYCASCVNTQQADEVADEGCSGARNRCVLDNGSNPSLNYAGTKCVINGYPDNLDTEVVDIGELNTAHGEETPAQKNDRMAGFVPVVDPAEELEEPNLGPFNQPTGPFRDPILNAKCLDEAYTVPSGIDPAELYADYRKIFDWGFSNTMGSPLQSVSVGNNGITNNRFPGMFLRMCFHDNSVDSGYPSFNQYVQENIDIDGKWDGPYTYLDTSGADASVLICPEERYHPNQNYDKTASRILYALQETADIGITDANGATSMVDKYYGLSYADLLHNGGIAAAIYLTETTVNDWSTVFKYGRHDACHAPEVGHRYRLCGPTQYLPGVMMEAEELNDWFLTRGMNECTWMALMWTHTTMVSSLIDHSFFSGK